MTRTVPHSHPHSHPHGSATVRRAAPLRGWAARTPLAESALCGPRTQIVSQAGIAARPTPSAASASDTVDAIRRQI